MNELFFYLSQPFAQHALIAATLVAIMCGLIGPFVIMRNMAFAVHGTSELAFTGAAAGLLVNGNPLIGAFAGAIIVALIIGSLGVHERERDAAIGIILSFGLGLGVLLLSFYKGFATQATNILFGNIFGVSNEQLMWLLGIGTLACLTLAAMYRPLLFASVDPQAARAKGISLRGISILFLLVLAVAVTEAAQVVGTLLVLSLAIAPAAAAARLSPRTATVIGLSISFALAASLGGVLLSLVFDDIKPSVFITALSFTIYIFVRLITWAVNRTTTDPK